VIRRQPGLQQRIHHGVEPLLRRVPGLEQVVVEVHDVDRVDGGTGVGVGGQQRPPRARVDVHGPLEELDAVHLRHAVVGQDHSDLLPAQLHLAQRIQGRLARLRAHDAVPFAVPAPQVPGHRAGDPWVVVHGHDGRPLPPLGVGRRHAPARAAGQVSCLRIPPIPQFA